MSELSILELEAEHGEVLPARETLGTSRSHNNYVLAFNLPVALAGAGHDVHNSAVGIQVIKIG
jgi:hypothetical protein